MWCTKDNMYWDATCLIKLEYTKDEMYAAPNMVLPLQNLMQSKICAISKCAFQLSKTNEK